MVDNLGPHTLALLQTQPAVRLLSEHRGADTLPRPPSNALVLVALRPLPSLARLPTRRPEDWRTNRHYPILACVPPCSVRSMWNASAPGTIFKP